MYKLICRNSHIDFLFSFPISIYENFIRTNAKSEFIAPKKYNVKFWVLEFSTIVLVELHRHKAVVCCTSVTTYSSCWNEHCHFVIIIITMTHDIRNSPLNIKSQAHLSQRKILFGGRRSGSNTFYRDMRKLLLQTKKNINISRIFIPQAIELLGILC